MESEIIVEQKTDRLTSKETNQILIGNILTGCEECGKVTSTKVLEIDGKVFLEKECCNEQVCVENDPDFYKRAVLETKISDEFIKEGDSIEKLKRRMKTKALMTNLYVTSKCNLNCPVCYMRDYDWFANVKDSPKEWVLKTIRNNRSKIITLLGAEPTLRDDLFEILKFAKKKRKVTTLVTNGIKLADFSFVKKLRESGLGLVFFSFDGFVDNIYSTLRGSKLLNKKMIALKNLKMAKQPTLLLGVIKKDVNENQIEPMIKFAVKNNDFIKYIGFSTYTTKYGIENTSVSDIYKKISKTFDIDIEYFIQMDKLRGNAFRVIEKFFGNRFANNRFFFLKFIPHFFNTKDGKLSPYFSVMDMERANKIMEDALKEIKIKSFIKLLVNLPAFIKPFQMMIGYRFCSILGSRTLYKKLNKNRLEMIILGVYKWMDIMDLKPLFVDTPSDTNSPAHNNDDSGIPMPRIPINSPMPC